jgi:prephenate dehydrogenase
MSDWQPIDLTPETPAELRAALRDALAEAIAARDAARRERDALTAALARLLELVDDFAAYYDIPAAHPDAVLIATEARAAREVLRRLGVAPTEAPADAPSE